MLSDPRVFDDDWLPHRLEHRERPVSKLFRLLEPATTGPRAEDALLYGPSGVGKTVLVRHCLSRLQEETAVSTARIRCLGKTTGGILLRALEQLPVDADVHRGLSIDQRRQLLAEAVDGQAVILLDEADDLHETDVLAAVSKAPSVSVIVIIHDLEEWLVRIDEDQRGRWTSRNMIELTRYGVDELADILEPRAEQGIEPAAWNRDLLEAIADDAAGVARRGIQTLRAAAEVADEEGAVEIGDEHVRAGAERAREQIRAANLDSLPFHHQVLYELIRDGSGSGVDAEVLHRRYSEYAEDIYRERPTQPISKRSRRNKLQKLRSYDLIERVGDGSAIRYVAHDLDLASPVGPLDRVDGVGPEITPPS